MTFNSALFDSTQLVLDIPEATQQSAWQQSQVFANATSRWTAYLNLLCLETLLPWLREDEPHTAPAPNRRAAASCWELVNGTALTLGDRRVVLIPTETIDPDEMQIPQEWVDIPSWAADYYFAVQVNPDDRWIRVVGFTTHRQLKEIASLNPGDRTYSLTDTDLIADLNVLWVSREVAPREETRSEISPLPALPLAQAQNLIQRLSSTELLVPRMAVPFSMWGGLLVHGGWRQQLIDRRRGLPEQRSVVQWLRSGLSSLAQQSGWQTVSFQPETVGARGQTETAPATGFARQLTIVGQAYELRVLPIGDPENHVWRFELRSLATGGRIPSGLTLRLLTEDLQPFVGNTDQATEATEALYVAVVLEPGEGIVWEVEPTPEDGDREILRF